MMQLERARRMNKEDMVIAGVACASNSFILYWMLGFEVAALVTLYVLTTAGMVYQYTSRP